MAADTPIATDNPGNMRWRMVITAGRERYIDFADEIIDFQDFVEDGPDWTLSDYRIEITYAWRSPP